MEGLKKQIEPFRFLIQMIQFLLAFGNAAVKQQRERLSIVVCACSNVGMKVVVMRSFVLFFVPPLLSLVVLGWSVARRKLTLRHHTLLHGSNTRRDGEFCVVGVRMHEEEKKHADVNRTSCVP